MPVGGYANPWRFHCYFFKIETNQTRDNLLLCAFFKEASQNQEIKELDATSRIIRMEILLM